MAKPDKYVPPLQRVLARMSGARLCFGRPVEAAGRTVIPVASVRTAGGGGFGSGPGGSEGSGGGGGALDARPVGYIEIGPEGVRFERIDDGRTALRAIAAGTFALLVIGRVLGRRRSSTRVLPIARVRRRKPSLPPPVARSRRRGLLGLAAPPARLARGGQSSQRS